MRLWRDLWRDERGSVLTAEAVLLGSLVVVGATAGLNVAATAVQDELAETAYAIRSLDQSYYYHGYVSCHAATAGSAFIQKPVEQSLSELRALHEKESKVEQKKKGDKKDPDTSGPVIKPKKKQPKPDDETDEL